MNKFFKRLALLLAVLMIVGMMPVQLFATNGVTYVNNSAENGEEEQSNATEETDEWKNYPADGTTMPDGVVITTEKDPAGTNGSITTVTLKDKTAYLYFTQVFDHAAAYEARKTLLTEDPSKAYPYEIHGADYNIWYTGYIYKLTVKLDCDIDLKNETVKSFMFDDIGNTYITFDGGYHTISNANLASSTGNIGFFGKGVSVKNVTLDNIHVTATGNPDNQSAGIVSSNADADIDSVTVRNSSVTGGKYTGGIVGYNYGSITNCTLENCTVSGQYKVGGVVGYICNSNDGVEYVTGNSLNGVTVKAENVLAGKTAIVGKTVGNWNAIVGVCGGNTFDGEPTAVDGIGQKEAGCTVSEPTYVATVNGTNYETLADAIAAANGNGTVTLLTATTELVQALLDGQYGSIDGLTIELPTGDYGQLELGRATKYAGSNTTYHIGGYGEAEMTFDDFYAAKNGTAWTGNSHYIRSMSNVTIKAVDGATVKVAGVKMSSGHIYGSATTPVYDYVLDKTITDNGGYYLAQIVSNIAFEGITFTANSNISASIPESFVNGFTFKNCVFDINNTASGNEAIRYYNELNNGNVSDLVVDGCTFNNCFQGVYTQKIKNVTVTNSKFYTTGHNAIAIQSAVDASDHGDVVISDNYFENVGDRIIRFGNVGEGTTITITGNTSVNSGRKSSGEIIAAETMPDSVNITMASNTWGDVNGKTAVLGDGFNKVVVATVNGTDYKSLADAIAAANDGETVTLLENIDVTETLKIAKNVIINLNGKTVTANDSCVNNIFDVTGTLKIAGDGIVDLKAKGIRVPGGTLEIAGGTFEYNCIGGAVVKMYYDANFKMTGGKLEIAAGSAVNPGYLGTQVIDISGGTIVCTHDANPVFFASSSFGTPDVTLNISGDATIQVVNPDKFVGDDYTKVAVSGGNFNVKIDDKYLADGFELIENADGTYGVAAKTYVATIGTVGYETLDEAIKAAKDGDVIVLAPGVTVYLTSGVANEGSNARKVTIKGDGTQTVDVITYAISAEGGMLNFQRGSSFTFDNVTVQAGEGNFDGIVCSALTLNKCTLKGKLTLYGAATFTGCTFENTMANQYSIWTWGGTDVKFEGCTFNTNGKAILLYGRATKENPTNLTVNRCEFNDSMNGAAGKAAIEIGNDYNATYTLVAENCTVNGFAEGKNTGSTLWGNKNSMADENLTVIKDNEVLHGGAAKVGDKNYATLEEALAAVTKDSPLTWVSETVWPVDTPVYYNGNFYKAHTVNYVSKGALDWAIEAANADNSAEVAKIYVRPGYNTEKGLVVNSHQNIKTSIAIYGNDASLCGIGWEPCVEYPGENYHTLTKDISIEIYNLHDGACVWGQRMTNFTVDVTMENCKNVHELMINGQYESASESVTNYTVRNCTFDGTKASEACPVTTTSAGKVIVEGCTFTGLNDNYVININNKNGGKTVVEVTDCEFNGCGATGKEVVRLTGEAEGSEIEATLSGLTFDETSSANAIIVGNKKVENNKASVSYTITGTSGTMNSYRIGETTAETTVLAGEEVKGNNAVAVAEVGGKKYSTLADALAAATDNEIIKILADTKTGYIAWDAKMPNKVVIDLNGKTLTVNKEFEVVNRGRTVTVVDNSTDANGVIKVTGQGVMDVGAKLILESGSIVCTGAGNLYFIYNTNPKMTVNGGTLVLAENAIYAEATNCIFEVTGGKVVCNSANAAIKLTMFQQSAITINITGGDLTGISNIIDYNSKYVTYSISGGKFSFDIPEEYCAKDYYPAHFNDGTMGVKKETVSTEEELRRALYEAALDGSLTRIKLTGNITLEMLYAAENFGTEKIDDNAIGDTFNRYKLGVHPTAEDPNHWNKLVTDQTLEERVVYGAYYHVGATDERIARLVIKAGQNVVIDLNGYTIEKNARATYGDWSNVCTDIIGNYGTLEIKDSAGTNGTIKGRGYISCGGAVLHNYENGVMTVGAVNVDGNAAGMAKGTGQYVIANDGGKTTINGTNVYDTVTADASLVVNTAGEMTITGNATLNHPAAKAINVKGGDVVIESATIISDKYSIYAAGGKTTITGEVTVNGTGKMAVSGGEIVKTADATVGGVPEGYAWFDNDDGTQSLSKVIATIGETSYKSLADALNAANDGETVKLLADVTADVAINKNITLDLGGKTLTNTNSGKATITIAAGTTATVKNGNVVGGTSYYNIAVGTSVNSTANLTLEDVTATAGNIASSMIDNWGTLTIKSGTYTGGLDVVKSEEGSTLVISGGKFELNYAKKWAFNAVILVYGDTTITGGEFINNAKTTSSYPQVVMTGIVEGYTPITRITGGTFTNNFNGTRSGILWALDDATADNFEVSGGTFNKQVDESYCADGFIPTKNADGTYGVKEGMYVAKVGSKKYETLADAIRLAANGKTITLLANVTEDVTIAKNLTLDLDGKTLTNTNSGKATLTIAAGATVTVKNGTIVGGTSYYAIQNNGTATLTDVTATAGNVGSSMIDNEGTLTITSGTYTGGMNTVINKPNANLTISGGVFENSYGEDNAHTGVIYNHGNVEITGGEFTQKATTPAWAYPHVIMTVYKGATPSTVITGGTFTSTLKNWKGTILNHDGPGSAGCTKVSGGVFNMKVDESYCADRYIPTQNEDGTYGVQEAMKGSKKNPYTLAELSVMTRDEYIAAQEALGGTMYVEVGNYSYDTHGVLGNGVRDDTSGQTPDHSKLNSYAENGYLGANNDGANGKNIIFVGGSITSGVTGYKDIDNIGTSLLLAVPAYTNVTFEGVTFNNVMSFNYQLYTSPWSQLGDLKFSGCTFNGLIVGSIAAQTLIFDGCVFTNYTNSASANNSNPTWIRPAYGNWSKGDNEGQGEGFRSLTTINFTNNTVTSTRPVKFEYISQWDITSTVTATGNYFDIKAQAGDKVIKNVGLYLGAHTDANEFHLVAENNTKSENTAAIYTIPEYKTSLPVDSTVKNKAGESIELTDALKWKATDAEKDKIVLKTVIAVASIGETRFATLAEAVEAAKNGDTITLLEDCESGRINLEDKSITVVLNGKTLTSTAAYGVMFCAKNGNKITIDGTVEGSKLVGTLMITAGTDGHIEVNGGTYENSQYCPIYVNGAVSNENSTVTVKNATITAIGTNSDQDMGCAVYLAGYSTSVFENCTITAPVIGIEIRAGKLTLNNCDVTGGNGKVTADANGNGTTVTNAALAISQHNTKKPIEVIINGGTFNGTAAVYQTDVQGTGSADVKIAVNDGIFNGTISGETDGAIVISGGKFKVKVDDKYFADGFACSGKPGDDGYYTVAAHPITKVGLTLGEDISIRIVVGAEYKDGKIKVTYETYDPNTKGMVTKELILDKYELAGTNKYQFRLSNITPQMADVVFTLQYLDSEGNEIGSAKQISIVKYCEGLTETSSFEAYKAKIGQLLNYCATAMDFRAVSHKDDVYNGLSWAERATALRAKISEYGYTVSDIDFKTVGKYINRTHEKIITGFGIEFAESVKLYYFIPVDNYKDGYTYVADGLMTPVPVYESGKLTGYRVYLTVAMDGYHTMRTLYVYDADGNEVQRIGMAPDYALKYLYNSGKQTNEFKQLCKAAYQYFIAFAE